MTEMFFPPGHLSALVMDVDVSQNYNHVGGVPDRESLSDTVNKPKHTL